MTENHDLIDTTPRPPHPNDAQGAGAADIPRHHHSPTSGTSEAASRFGDRAVAPDPTAHVTGVGQVSASGADEAVRRFGDRRRRDHVDK